MVKKLSELIKETDVAYELPKKLIEKLLEIEDKLDKIIDDVKKLKEKKSGAV